MPNIGGPTNKKRNLLVTTVHSMMLYGTEMWHSALQMEKYSFLMEKAERKLLLRVTSSYRTVSTKALQVISGIVPIHLFADEKRKNLRKK